MQEIKCPNCGEIFAVDESGYAQIVRQVRDKEFEKEIRQREKDLEQIRDGELKLARMEQKQEFDRALSAKDAELFERDKTIEQLRERLSGSETQKELAISRAVQEKERELTGKAAEIAELKNRLSNKAAESELREQSLRKQYEDQLRQKDELIGYYKDFKARQSTKMIGESLEQHCLNQFNSLRMTAFPAAYFEKDNDVRTGSKGDFIFRESAEGTEFISIMFEMKNEIGRAHV